MCFVCTCMLPAHQRSNAARILRHVEQTVGITVCVTATAASENSCLLRACACAAVLDAHAPLHSHGVCSRRGAV